MKWTLGVAMLLLVCCSLQGGSAEVCGNGVVQPPEECDDLNVTSGDGCSENCTVESHYYCHPDTSPSQCSLVLLDLSSDDVTTLDRSVEFFHTNTPVFLVDPNTLEFLVNDSQNWEYLDIVILQGDGISISESVWLEFMDNPSPPNPFQQDVQESDYPSGINGRNITGGRRILIDASITALVLSAASALAGDSLQTVLEAAAYQAHETPSNFLPRYVCLVARDPDLETTACVAVYYIGFNVNQPRVEYDGSVAVFVEGGSQPLAFVTGNITVSDPDHPRYLMESATVSISGFTSGSREWLSLDSNYTLPDGFSVSFITGTLTISGNATTEVYSQILQQLTYFNNMTQPHETREIEVTVYDGTFFSDPVTLQINIMNTNDNPSVSLYGEFPIITSLTRRYTEGSGAVAIVDNIHVIDVDPNAMITRATIVVTNLVDEEQEILAITNTRGLALSSDSYPPHNITLELSGERSPSEYNVALRSLTYHHLNANPGNPSPHTRLIEFTVEDSYNTTSSPSTLMLEIVLVNDAPILSFLSGGSEEEYYYTEDDPPINIGANLTLSDIDSDIQSVSLYLPDLPDSQQDIVDYDSSLVTNYSLSVTTNGTSRLIVFSGTSPPSMYTEVLQSLTYTNLYTNDSITDGIRLISVCATDSVGLKSTTTLTLLINVTQRNDGPVIDLGAGNDQGFTLNFVEGGPERRIGINNFLSISDEEGNAVSRMEIELVATNGPLDEGDTLVLRTPLALPLFSYPDTVVNETRIIVGNLSSDSDYVDTLNGVRYSNSEDEPTLYNVDGARLQREIVISITDSAPVPSTNVVRVTVEIMPINDNAPRIIINSEPRCTQDSRDSQTTVFRRSVGASSTTPSQRRRRRRSNTQLKNLAAPQVVGAEGEFTVTSGDGTPCLFQMVLQFNTDTSAPMVEIQKGLDSLLTFAPASLAKTPHRGYWRDYKTLVIQFKECVQWNRDERKPLYVVFYGSGDSCTWDSPCNEGVCYYNSTGCPVVGYHRVNTTTNEGGSPTSAPEENITTVNYGPDRASLLILSSVLLVAVVTVASCQCRKSVKGRYGTGESQQKSTKPPVPTYVIEIQAPISKRSPPPPQSPASVGKCQEKGLPKDGHPPPPPPYVESCAAATLTSTAVDMAQKKTGNTDDDDIVNDEQQCEGAEDNDKCLRREKGQVPPSIDTGGTGESGGEEEGQDTQGNSAPPREHSRNTYTDRQSNNSTQIPH